MKKRSGLLLVRLGRSRVIPPHALTSAALLLVAAAAETATLLLVPGAQGLSAKGQILVLDDGGLDPGVGRGVNFASRGVEGLEIGDEVVAS